MMKIDRRFPCKFPALHFKKPVGILGLLGPLYSQLAPGPVGQPQNSSVTPWQNAECFHDGSVKADALVSDFCDLPEESMSFFK